MNYFYLIIHRKKNSSFDDNNQNIMYALLENLHTILCCCFKFGVFTKNECTSFKQKLKCKKERANLFLRFSPQIGQSDYIRCFRLPDGQIDFLNFFFGLNTVIRYNLNYIDSFLNLVHSFCCCFSLFFFVV